jgi:hypothetical protein
MVQHIADIVSKNAALTVEERRWRIHQKSLADAEATSQRESRHVKPLPPIEQAAAAVSKSCEIPRGLAAADDLWSAPNVGSSAGILAAFTPKADSLSFVFASMGEVDDEDMPALQLLQQIVSEQ